MHHARLLNAERIGQQAQMDASETPSTFRRRSVGYPQLFGYGRMRYYQGRGRPYGLLV